MFDKEGNLVGDVFNYTITLLPLATIYQCTQVSKQWSAHSLPHLYKHLSLDLSELTAPDRWENNSACRRLLAFTGALPWRCPHNGRFIQTLEIHVDATEIFRFSEKALKNAILDTNRLMAGFGAVVGCATNVKNVEIDVKLYDPTYRSRDQFPQELEDALHCATATTLSIMDICRRVGTCRNVGLKLKVLDHRGRPARRPTDLSWGLINSIQDLLCDGINKNLKFLEIPVELLFTKPLPSTNWTALSSLSYLKAIPMTALIVQEDFVNSGFAKALPHLPIEYMVGRDIYPLVQPPTLVDLHLDCPPLASLIPRILDVFQRLPNLRSLYLCTCSLHAEECPPYDLDGGNGSRLSPHIACTDLESLALAFPNGQRLPSGLLDVVFRAALSLKAVQLGAAIAEKDVLTLIKSAPLLHFLDLGNASGYGVSELLTHLSEDAHNLNHLVINIEACSSFSFSLIQEIAGAIPSLIYLDVIGNVPTDVSDEMERSKELMGMVDPDEDEVMDQIDEIRGCTTIHRVERRKQHLRCYMSKVREQLGT